MKKYIAGAAAFFILAGFPLTSSAEKVFVFGEEYGNKTPKTATPAETPQTVTPAETPQTITPVENFNTVVGDAQEEIPTENLDDDEELGEVLNFDDPSNRRNNYEDEEENNLRVEQDERQVEQVTPALDVSKPEEDFDDLEVREEKSRKKSSSRKSAGESSQQSSAAGKPSRTAKIRFVKVAIDDTYDYYLDKESIVWRRVPFTANEYMADVWIRMIEHNVDTANYDADMATYIQSGNREEISLAREKGIQIPPSDVKVLRNRKYYLEHYYMRPARKQIQFLCELEVVGHPQNSVSERKYSPTNWEDLIPGSIESAIYKGVIEVIGSKKASGGKHSTVADWFEETLRISIR